MRTAEMPQAKRHELDRLFHAFTRIMNSHTSELNTMLLEYRNRMNFIMHSALQKEHNRIERIQEVMIRDIAVKKNTAAGELQKQIRLLDAYSPLKILERGYGVISHEGMIVNSVDMVETDDMIDVRLKDGSVRAKIEQKEKNHHEKGNV
jgi:exodeoxyribonuclease VII large subunit